MDYAQISQNLAFTSQLLSFVLVTLVTLILVYSITWVSWAKWPKIAMISIQGYGPEVEPTMDWAFGPEYQINSFDQDLSDWCFQTMTKDVMVETDPMEDLFNRLNKMEEQQIQAKKTVKSSRLFKGVDCDLDATVNLASKDQEMANYEKGMVCYHLALKAKQVQTVPVYVTVDAEGKSIDTLKEFCNKLLATADLETIMWLCKNSPHQVVTKVFGPCSEVTVERAHRLAKAKLAA